MVTAANLGFPRIGPKRELKKATESYWKGEISLADLESTAQQLRAQNWRLQKDAGIAVIPSNDFSFYDQVLDTTAMVGAVPPRFGFAGDTVDLDTYFTMARGRDDAFAMEMTKWFDTNYHYIVPEFAADQDFRLASTKPVDQFLEAKSLGIETRPVLVGPVTYLKLGKAKGGAFDPVTLLDRLLPVYEQVLNRLAEAGASWVQIDEPILVLDLSEAEKAALKTAYERLARSASLKILVATYFEALGDNLDLAAGLPVAGLHVDLKRAPDQLGAVLDAIGGDTVLSVGVIDGRNIWRADLDQALEPVKTAVARLGAGRVQVAPSCSLLHSPIDLDNEEKLDAEFKSWLAFAKQKLREVTLLAGAADGKADEAAFADARQAAATRRSSPRIHDQAVKDRLAAVTAEMMRRVPFAERQKAQAANFHLPPFPTTTIGSFPQTKEVRQKRAAFRRGELSAADYDAFVKAAIDEAVRWQEEIGIDALVHGEFERNDMVEYFGELLDGYAFTQHGWVQSYGSRYVKPPIIFGDVSRPQPMTVKWSGYAASKTERPMKGMLTGPVTMLQWAFVRDDQPREATAKQIALALRDEVVDLEAANIKMIQIDEPALREGLPLKRKDWDAYLNWAVEAFRLSASGVQPGSQIHTHMCYAEFNDIIDSIAGLDADVISIETSRSDMELLDAFVKFRYPNQIGPGVYDIHSPRVPNRSEMENLLAKAVRVLRPEQIWVNPDCGLKTRGWAEVKPALESMVDAARSLRQQYAQAAE
ncbi:MAG: 5-methyltetrahydropteroyltriglutamate--homocysteine S-methyltransferase [Azospirillaceae bacterium]